VPDSVILRPLGRISEPSSTVAPPGSLLRAQNCVVRSPGVLAPVADLTELSDASGPTGRGVWQVSPQFDNGAVPEQLCHVSNGISAQNGVRKTSAMGTEIQYPDPDGTDHSIEYFDHGDGLTMYPMHVARENLYLCDQVGVYKWMSTDDTALEPVWDRGWASATGTADTTLTGKFLATGNHVRYRIVIRHEDSNGVITRSAPTRGFRFVAAAANNVSLDVAIDEWYADSATFQAVEIYRTRQLASTVTLPNEYYLVDEIPAADFAAGTSALTATYLDTRNDSALNAALYTNSSREGIEAANYAPPEHLYHAEFRGHQFWANVAEPEVIVVKARLRAGSLMVDSDGSPATTFSGNANITNVLNTGNGGAFIESLESPKNWPDGAYILDFSGTTATLSEQATVNGTSEYRIHDTLFLRYGDGTADRISLYQASGRYLALSSLDRSWAYSMPETAPNRAWLVDFAAEDIAGESAFLTLTFATRGRPGRQGRTQAWITQASDPADVTYTIEYADLDAAGASGSPTTGGTETPEALHRRRIYWSKHQEPEHTTLGNFVDLPTEIVGLGALEDALIILCKGGVHRLTGDNGNWRVDPIDTSVDIIGGRSTAVAWNRVYTLGNRGLLEITSGGVRNITDDIAADWFREADWDDARIEDVRQYMVNNDGYHPPTLFAAADPTHREYVLMCEGSDSPLGDGVTSEMLVYNAGTQAFTTWALDEDGAFAVSVLGYARGDYSTLTADQAPGIVVGRQYSSGDTSAALHLLDERQVARVNGYSQFTQDIAFREMHEGDPTHMKVWTSIVWETDGNGEIAAAVFQGDEGDGQVTQAPTYAGREYRLWPPRSVKRSTQLVCGLQCTGVTVLALRATFSSGGREVPL